MTLTLVDGARELFPLPWPAAQDAPSPRRAPSAPDCMPRMRLKAVPFLAALLTLVAAPAAQAFDARGSAHQVDVTGLPAGAKASLIRPDGSTAKTRTANALGGMLFRNIKARAGYTVRSG